MSAIKLSAALCALILAFNACAEGNCQAVAAGDRVPSVIGRGQCFELQGNNTLDGTVKITGKLAIKADTRFELPAGAKLDVMSKGELLVRGTLAINENAKVTFDEYGRLESQGQILIKQGGSMTLGRAVTAVNSGTLRLFPASYLELGRDVKLRNSGNFILDNGSFKANFSTLENVGTISVEQGSTLAFTNNSTLLNKGLIKQESTCTMRFSETSRFTNRKNANLKGTFEYRQTAALQNYGNLKLLEGSLSDFYDGATVNNTHTITLTGTMRFHDHAGYENGKSLRIEEGGLLHLTDVSSMVNNGTIHDGGKVVLRRPGQLRNKNIFYLHGERANADLNKLLNTDSALMLEAGSESDDSDEMPSE